MTSGATGYTSYPPKVLVVERMYLSQLPEEDREPFLAEFGNQVEKSRAGEPVFPKEWYTKWKRK